MLDINRAYFAISNTPGTSGNFTVSTAQTDFRTLGAAHDGGTIDGVLIVESGVGWELRSGCVYTNGTTTLTRGTLEESSSGSAINFTSAATISIGNSALFASRARLAMQAVTPGGRLTLESGVPVSTTDQTAKTNVYYTPFKHNIITLWDGNAWVPVTFSEITLALGTVTSGIGYDVFAYLSGGSLAIEKLAWTSATARATAVTLQDGRYCKSGDKTRLLIGSIYTTSTTTTEDSETARYVGNVYNRVPRRLYKDAGSSSHTYNSTTVRQYNGGTGDLAVRAMLPILNTIEVSAAIVLSNSASGTAARVSLGWDDTASYTDAYTSIDVADATGNWRLGGAPLVRADTGRHTVYMNEARANGTGNMTADFGRLVGFVMS